MKFYVMIGNYKTYPSQPCFMLKGYDVDFPPLSTYEDSINNIISKPYIQNTTIESCELKKPLNRCRPSPGKLSGDRFPPNFHQSFLPPCRFQIRSQFPKKITGGQPCKPKPPLLHHFPANFFRKPFSTKTSPKFLKTRRFQIWKRFVKKTTGG